MKCNIIDSHISRGVPNLKPTSEKVLRLEKVNV